jgi:hypothetical protein
MNQQLTEVDVPKLVFEAVTNAAFVGLPSNLIFDNDKLYFLARTPISQLYVVDVPTTIPKEGLFQLPENSKQTLLFAFLISTKILNDEFCLLFTCR